jgi:hypothetical protein
MGITNYSELQTAVAKWLHRTDLTAQLPDFITIAENKLNNLSTNQTSGNIKFALTEAVFGKIEDYHQGLVEALGYPDPKLDVAIEHEHCRRADSHKKFNPGNYENVETTPFECESCSFARTND